MKVLKFGGSSVAAPSRIKEVAAIVFDTAKKDKTIIVVSAFQGITNKLLESAHLAADGKASYKNLVKEIASKHRKAVDELLKKDGKSVHLLVDSLLQEYTNALNGIYLLRHAPPRVLDVVGSFGERLSATIISAYLSKKKAAPFVDAREFVVTDDHHTSAAVRFEQTNPKIRRYFKALFAKHRSGAIPVVTGFIGSTEDGHTTTIGRNGSDYTAAIVGAALDASVIEIWTDVDGILSADPGAVPSAFVLPHMSYEEAMELSYFGAKVLHSATIAPAVARKIPVLIKNTMNPSAPGTLISDKSRTADGVARGITSVDEMALLTLRGMSMVGVPGTAERLFRSLAANSVNVILISQASSEHTICFAVTTADAPRARKAIEHEFRYELQHHLTSLDEKHSQTIVAVVGDGMKGMPGVSGKLFQSLGVNNVNINAIAQGASERNISLVINSVQKVRALNVIHQAFFEKRKYLSLVVVGIGNIGGALLEQLRQQQEFLKAQGFDVRVCAITNTKKTIASAEGIPLHRWKNALNDSRKGMALGELIKLVNGYQLTNIALIDCTASPEIVEKYPEFVEANMHIITPNKKANVLPTKQYDAFMEQLQKRQKYFLYEANVGAGLPIISTLNDLIASGDTVIKIEGILSGTLSYLFNTYDGKQPFSSLVKEAHKLGFTEPDPRDDLSGQDVARKLLILARQLGWKMDLKDIHVDSLVPAALRGGSFTKAFYGKYARYDSLMARRFAHAKSKKSILRFAGILQNGRASAGLYEFPLDHPFAGTEGSDNIIAFTTKRYSRTPLVVQGPGAGADVTAMGVFSDLLKLLHYLPY